MDMAIETPELGVAEPYEALLLLEDPALLVEETVTCVVQVRGKVRDRVEVPSDIGEDALRELVLARPKVQAAVPDGIRTVVVRAPKLVNVVPA